MKTYFENIIDKRPLYSGGAYVFTACVSCTSSSIKYEVRSPFESTKHLRIICKQKIIIYR